MSDLLKPIAIILGVLGVVFGLYKVNYPTYTYRYRMTVELEVDGQLRSGSSVVEVATRKAPVLLHENVGTHFRQYGDAVYVDHGNGKNIVALLATGKFALGGPLPLYVSRHFGVNPTDEAAVRTLRDRKGSWSLSANELPTLVTFADSSNPSTVSMVEPDEVEQVFGPNVRWRGVTVEPTTDAITRDIATHLPWVPKLVSGPNGTTEIGRPGRFTLNAPYFRVEEGWLW